MLANDLKYALRGLRRDTLYSAAAIGTLALTLGASTAVFSLVNGVLLRPLPYREPDRLVSIREVMPKSAAQYPTLPANARHFEEWRNRATSFSALAGLDWRTTSIGGVGEPFQAPILRTSGTLFDVLQVPLALGRGLTREDERADRPRVVVISDALWRERFAASPGVLGRTVTLSGIDHTIVGVLPPRVDVPSFDVLGDGASLRWRYAAIVPFRLNLANIGWMGTFNYSVIGRLRPGSTIEQARAELDLIQQSIAILAQAEAGEPVELRAQIVPLDTAIVGRARLGLLLLLGAVLGVVLIACANLANLSLSRTFGRLRDAAVRTALGASRATLIRTVVLEQLMLAAAGAAFGTALAYVALRAFVTGAPTGLPRAADVEIDARVFAFAMLLAAGAAVAVSVLPAYFLSRRGVQPVLRAGGHGTTDGGGVRLRGLLLGLQVALSVALLAVTGLFVTSFARLLGVDPGFSTERVVTLEIAPASGRYPDVASRAALYDRIGERVRQLPGVSHVSWTSALPLTGETWVDSVSRVDDPRPDSEKPNANYRFVGPDYFRVLSIPILKGESFADRDRTRAITPAVISARAAQALWPGQDPVGRIFTRADPQSRFEVVGVVVDGHPTALDTDAPLMVYVPYWYNTEGRSMLVARATGDTGAIVSEMRMAIRRLEPDLAIGDAGPLSAVVETAVAARRYHATLLAAFGGMALLIATIGVYATTAYGVSRRRREMNIRVALGAPASGVFALVLRQTTLPLAAGVAAGCAAALAAGPLVARLLFQITPRDPLVLSAAASIVGAAGVVSAIAAVRAGLDIDPVQALRQD